MSENEKRNFSSEANSNKREIVSRDKLQEAGVYFGTRKAQWNPKMAPYIRGAQKGIHIIDTVKTKRALEFAYGMIKKYAEKGANFIFVGTRKQAKDTIKENALRTNSHYVSERWLGGTLTNNRTIFNRVKRMFELEKMQETDFEGYTKKEGVMFSKELAKLNKNLNGIRNMKFRPNVMISADPQGDLIAIKEAKRLGIKVIGVVDTNVDPTIVDIAIPANDDSVKSLSLIITILADAIVEAKNGQALFAYQPDSAIVLPEDLKPEWKIKKEKRQAQWDKRKTEFKRRDSNVDTSKTEATKTPAPKAEVKPVAKEEVKTEAKVETKSDSSDLSSLKVAELKKLVEEKGLKVEGKGLKADLVKALEGAK